MLEHWFRGIRLEFRSASPGVVLQDCPSVQNEPDVTAAELDRLPSVGKIRWREKDGAPADLGVSPPQLVAKGGKVRVVRDWPNYQFCLNEAPGNLPVNYGDKNEFLQLL